MVAGSSVRQIEQVEAPLRGLLFRLSARFGALVFAGVFAVSALRGMDLSLAFMRGLLALLAVTFCGWLAEQIVRAATREEPPAPAEEADAEAVDEAAEPATDAPGLARFDEDDEDALAA